MRLSQRLLDLAGAAVLGLIGFWAFSRHVTDYASDWKRAAAIMRFDAFGLYYPMLDYASASLRDGRLPLWNPFQLAGQPFLATFYSGTLYPLNAPYLFLPVDQAMWLTTVGHVLLAGWMVALYARVALGVSRTASLAAGIVFMVSAKTLLGAFALNQLYSFPWIPLLFLGVDRAIRTPNLVWILPIALGIALPVLGGNVQVLSYEIYALVPYAAACVAVSWRGAGRFVVAGRSLAILAFGGVLGLLIAAPQLIPTLELSQFSVRSTEGLTLSQIGGTIPWKGLQSLVAGGPDPLVYPGAVVFLVIPFAFVSSSTRLRAFALALAGVLAALLTYSASSPVGAAYLQMPMGDWFRRLSRVWIITMFSLAGLAALGLDGVYHKARRPIALTFRCVVVLVFTAVVASYSPVEIRWLIAGSGLALLVLIAGLIHGRLKILVALGVIALLLLQLDRSLPVNHIVLPYVGRDYRGLYAAREAFEWAHNLEPRQRIISQEILWKIPTTPKLGTLYRIPVFLDYEPFTLKIYRDWLDQMIPTWNHKMGPYAGSIHLTNADFDPKFLDYAGVSHVIYFTFSPENPLPKSITGMNFLRKIRLPGLADLGARDASPTFPHWGHIFRNPYFWPRAFLANDVRTVENSREALKLLKALPRGSPPCAIIEASDSVRIPAATKGDGRADIVVMKPERVVVKTSSPDEKILVLLDAFYPGWVADIDGRVAPILRANHLFRAVVLPPGQHLVTFRYKPFSVRLGFWLGGAGLFVTLLIAALAWRRRPRAHL